MPVCPLFGRNQFHLTVYAPAESGQGGSWSGFEEELTRLDATITDVALASSTPTLQVRARDGLNWTVELAGRQGTEEAGLTDRLASPGDAVIVLGRLSRSFGDTHIKALRLTIGRQEFDLYPELLAEG